MSGHWKIIQDKKRKKGLKTNKKAIFLCPVTFSPDFHALFLKKRRFHHWQSGWFGISENYALIIWGKTTASGTTIKHIFWNSKSRERIGKWRCGEKMLQRVWGNRERENGGEEEVLLHITCGLAIWIDGENWIPMKSPPQENGAFGFCWTNCRSSNANQERLFKERDRWVKKRAARETTSFPITKFFVKKKLLIYFSSRKNMFDNYKIKNNFMLKKIKNIF